MRKLGKVKKVGKGKRWKKGDSCASNPVSRKHRELVKQSVIHGRQGKGGLTGAALEKHNERLEEEDDDDVTFQDENGSEYSAFSKISKPFSISGLTDCTNMTFNKVLRMWSSPSEESRQVCAVLAAVTEVIRAQGGTETEVEYFGALMTALENVPQDDKTTAAAIVFLLSLAIKRVPVAVLRAKFSEASKIFSDLLQFANREGNTSMLKNIIFVLSVLLSNQDAQTWANSSTLQMYYSILSFADNQRPKARKAAHTAVNSILKLNLANFKHHPAGASTAKYCIQELEKDREGSTTSLHVLNLLKKVIQYFSADWVKKTCETVLKLMTLGNMTTKVSCLEVLHNLFRAAPPENTLPSTLNGKIVSALYDFQPSINDTQVAAAWLKAMESAHVNLFILDEKLCLQSLPRLYMSVMAYLLSDFTDVAKNATDTMKVCIEKCIVPVKETIIDTEESVSLKTFQSVFRIVEGGLKYKYHTVWHLVLSLIAAFFQEFGRCCPKIMLKCVVTLCDLHESHNFPCIGELEKTVGAAIREMGPRIVLNAVSLGLERSDNVCEFPRSWLLPVLATYVKKTELQFFVTYFLPLAASLREKALKATKEKLDLESKVYDTLQQQIWGLLPGFCSGSTDLCQSFKNIARILGTALTERNDLRTIVLFSLRTLVNSTEDKEATSELSKYCKNFLPILFNLYTQDKENDQVIVPAILETIKILLTISDVKLIATFAGKAHEKLTQEDDISSKKKYSLMDLLVAMTPYLEERNVERVYKFASPLVKEKDKSMQKKAYRILEEICAGRNEGCANFVLNHLQEIKTHLVTALSSSAPSSKAPRLRCLGSVVRKLSAEHLDFIMSLLPEVILCTKEVSSKARSAALSLLVEISNLFIYFNSSSKEECIRQFFLRVTAGFGGSPHMKSATMLALTRLLQEYREYLDAVITKMLVNTAIELLKSKEREITKTALVFTRKLIAITDANDFAGFAQDLIEALFSGKDEKKNLDKYERQIVLEKLMRKLGFDTVRAMTPPQHRRFIANIHKMTEKSRKLKRDKRMKVLETDKTVGTKENSINDLLEESESEDDTEDQKIPALSKPKSWIIEDDTGEAIDLLDPKASQFVVGTHPKKKAKKEEKTEAGFKLSSDGRLIIAEEQPELGKDGSVVGPDGTRIPEKIILGKRKYGNDDDEDEDDNVENQSSKYLPGGTGIHRPILKSKLRKANDDGKVKSGLEYKAKKAKGDIKLKGKPDPFAYIPLDKSKLNKRKKVKLSGQFYGIVKAAKRGAIQGKKRRVSAK